MKTKHYLPIWLVVFLLIACSNQVPSGSFVTQQPSSTLEVTALPIIPKIVDSTFTLEAPALATTPKSVDATSSHTLIPTVTMEISPTQTPMVVDFGRLPKLSDVIISSADFENIDELQYYPLLLVTDVTSELQDSCLWDCVKYRYSLEEGTLTIMLLRAGNPQKAESTLANLRKDFLKTIGIDYTVSDLSMPPTAWAMVDAASNTKDTLTGVAGIAHGSIVILVTYSQVFCEYTTEFGRYCEGDTMTLASTAVYFLELQIQKLETAGYPE